MECARQTCYGRPMAPQILQELKHALIEEWERTPQIDFRILKQSMPHRSQAVINARGEHTLY